MSKWTPNAPPPDMESEVVAILEDQAKRKRIRAYAMAALPGVIQVLGKQVSPKGVAIVAMEIAEAMEKEEHERNR